MGTLSEPKYIRWAINSAMEHWYSFNFWAKVHQMAILTGENAVLFTCSEPTRASPIGYTRDFVLWSRYHSSHTHPKSMAASTKLPSMHP